MKGLKLSAILVLVLLVLRPAEAQIVNIENQRLSSKKEGWMGSVDLWFNLLKNTNVIFQLGSRNKVLWTRKQNSVLCITDIAMVKANNADLVNSGFGHVRYSRQQQKFGFLYWESFQQAQYNRVQLINLRLLTGTGLRAIVLDRDSASLNLGSFIMAEYEQQSDNIINQTLRYSCFISFDFQFTKTFGVNAITYYQPDFLDPDDFRLSVEASMRLKITERLSYSLIYNLYYDSRPVTSIPLTTYGLKNTLRYSF